MNGRPRVADLRPGDLVRLRKAHPCGGFWWLVNRVGGDVGLRCETCGHYVMVPRFRIERRIREVARPAAENGESDMEVGQSAAAVESDAKAQGRKDAKRTGGTRADRNVRDTGGAGLARADRNVRDTGGAGLARADKNVRATGDADDNAGGRAQ